MSEFGRGVAYCLGLFLCHSERKIPVGDEDNCSLEVYGAADHLAELDASAIKDNELRNKLEAFRDYVWSRRLDHEISKEDWKDMVDSAKELLRDIDKYMHVEVEKGDYA